MRGKVYPSVRAPHGAFVDALIDAIWEKYDWDVIVEHFGRERSCEEVKLTLNRREGKYGFVVGVGSFLAWEDGPDFDRHRWPRGGVIVPWGDPGLLGVMWSYVDRWAAYAEGRVEKWRVEYGLV